MFADEEHIDHDECRDSDIDNPFGMSQRLEEPIL
jgi:hypothetical protein